MEEAQHHLSIIEQKSTMPISETLNQEELNSLRYHRCSPPKKPFQKSHLKQNQKFDHRITHHQNKKHHSNHQNECSHCGAKGHRGN